MEVREAYCNEDFEWDNLQKLAKKVSGSLWGAGSGGPPPLGCSVTTSNATIQGYDCGVGLRREGTPWPGMPP